MNRFTISNIMTALAAVLLFSASVFAQDVVITEAATFNGTGTFNIKGNIVDSATSTKTITGTTVLNGTGPQGIGDNAQAGIGLNFHGLKTASATAKTMKLPVAVMKKLDLDSGQLVINTHNLTIDSATAKNAGTLSATTARVIYDGSGAFTQTVIDASYSSLQLTSSSPKVLMNTVTADTLAHSGAGGLGVNFNLTVNAVGTINTLDSASAGKTLQFAGSSSNNSIATVAAASGTIDNAAADTLSINTINGNAGTIQTATAPLLVGALNANAGTIQTTGAGTIAVTGSAVNSSGGTIKTTGAGDLHFGGTTSNSGSITASGQAASVRFQSTVTNAGTGRIVGGNDSVAFAAALTNNGVVQAPAGIASFAAKVTNTDSIAVSGATTASFTDSVNNGGVLALAGTSQSTFTRSINNSGTLAAANSAQATYQENFGAKGSMIYDTATTAHFIGADSLPVAKYGNLHLAGANNKAAIGNDTLAGHLQLDRSLVMNGHEFAYTHELATVSNFDTMEVIGKVKRDHPFQADKYYAFNRDSVGLGVTAAANSSSMAIDMVPAQDLPGTISAKHITRQYLFSGTNTNGLNLSKLALTYSDAERTSALVLANGEARLGIRSYAGTTWSKVNNPGSPYSRNANPSSNVIVDSSLNASLASVTEFGIINNAFQTIAGANWNVGSTWDEGSAPTATDDAEIWNTGVTVTSPAFAAGLEVLPSQSLSIASSQLTVADLFNLNSGATGGLNVASGATLQLNSTFRINGPVTNNGTINAGN